MHTFLINRGAVPLLVALAVAAAVLLAAASSRLPTPSGPLALFAPVAVSQELSARPVSAADGDPSVPAASSVRFAPADDAEAVPPSF